MINLKMNKNKNKQNFNTIPIPGTIYIAKITDINRLGILITLNDFRNKFETLIHKSEVAESLDSYTVGNQVKVKIVSFAMDGKFFSATMKGVSQPKQHISRSDHKDWNKDDDFESKRVVRVASPGRRLTKQKVSYCNEISLSVVKEEPKFLQALQKVVPLQLKAKVHVFKNTNSHMARIAQRKMKDNKITPFHYDSSGSKYEWVKSDSINKIFHELSISSSFNRQCPIDFRVRQKMSIQEQRESLPIYALRDDIIQQVTNNRVLICVGETGSGKTTQITQYLVEAGFVLRGKIGCTQPRRVAAISVAKRVAEEYGCVLGREVGYKIRFDDSTSEGTLIKYMTDGILLRECLADPDLSAYSVIILDEAHERSIHTDVLFGLLKKAIQRQPKLRVVVSSATLDSRKFSRFFDNAPVLCIPGCMYPVEIFYRQYNENDYFNVSLITAMNIHLREPTGDILLFFTGEDEIERACDILEKQKEGNNSFENLTIIPLYSALPYEKQMEVFAPSEDGNRKIIISTNIAETSMTIDGVKYVIDPGYHKTKIYDPVTGVDTLTILPISQASADQRAGRAGRTAPGKCFRIYTENSYNYEMLLSNVPEIQRTNLMSVVLQLKAMKIKDVLQFEFMDAPTEDTILMALKKLYLLDALDDKGDINPIGIRMAEIPVDPHLAKMIIMSFELKCTDEIITIVSMLNSSNIFFRPKRTQLLADEKKGLFLNPVGDHLTLLEVYKSWKKNFYSSKWCKQNYLNEKALNEARELRKHLLLILEQNGHLIYSAGFNIERIQKAICAGFFENVAMRNGTRKNYKTLVDSQEVFIHPSSALHNGLPQCIIYNEMIETNKKYLREVTIIDPKWLIAFAPKLYKANDIHKSDVKEIEDLLDLVYRINEVENFLD